MIGKLKYSIKKEVNINAVFQQFFFTTSTQDGVSKDLEFEMDLVTLLKLNNFESMQAGYSQSFISKEREIIKINYDENNKNFAWEMLTMSANLFTLKKMHKQ